LHMNLKNSFHDLHHRIISMTIVNVSKLFTHEVCAGIIAGYEPLLVHI